MGHHLMEERTGVGSEGKQISFKEERKDEGGEKREERGKGER